MEEARKKMFEAMLKTLPPRARRTMLSMLIEQTAPQASTKTLQQMEANVQDQLRGCTELLRTQEELLQEIVETTNILRKIDATADLTDPLESIRVEMVKGIAELMELQGSMEDALDTIQETLHTRRDA